MLLKKMFGYKTAQEIHAACKLSFHRILKTSQNDETKNLCKLKNNKNIRSDYILKSPKLLKSTIFKNFFKPKSEWHGFLKLK